MIACPYCKQDVTPDKVGFTWWGGFIGASILSHVQCPACRGRFNSKSGQPNTKAIATYIVVVGVLSVALMITLLKM